MESLALFYSQKSPTGELLIPTGEKTTATVELLIPTGEKKPATGELLIPTGEKTTATGELSFFIQFGTNIETKTEQISLNF